MDLALAQGKYSAHFDRFEQWLDGGMAGDMGYLPRGRERRRDPLKVFPEAKSVFCAALPYSAAPLGGKDQGEGPRLARYLRGEDYHLSLVERMGRILNACSERWIRLGRTPLKWKVCVDTSAVLERAWAALCGVGWIGKNSMLIHSRQGSYLFLGVAFLNQETGESPRPNESHCGNCRRCLDACPTGALLKPGCLDARRCISYWTLEKRGELPLSDADKRALGTWIAGCDLCQEACPFNAKVAKLDAGDQKDDRLSRTWEELFAESPEAYAERVGPTALSRIKAAEWQRNLRLAAANRF